MLLAAAIGCFVAGILTLIFFITFLGNLFTFDEGAPVIHGNSVLRIDMSQVVFAEKKESADLQTYLQGEFLPSVTLWDAVRSIKAAEADPRINYIFLKPDGLFADIAQIEELRQALLEFRQSGKAVVSFCEFPSLGSYYLASVSDKIYLSANKGAGPQINGVATQMFFLGDLLNKLDVNVQLIRHGKFKSAGEMFIKSEPSAENLLQTKEMVGSIWNSVADDIAAARSINADVFKALVDDLKLKSNQDMIDNGLADELLTREELKEKLATLSGVISYDGVNYIGLPDYIQLRSGARSAGRNQIAILVASGEIVEGFDDVNIAGDTYATAIAQLRNDPNVKAVVLRVASPGGSVLASDKIKTEIDLLRKEKPVIASYGSYAASGGYWISNSCDRIFTDKTTLTGSIGVFSMIPDFSHTLRNKLHVNIVTVGSTKHNGGLFTALDSQEKEAIQGEIEEIYQAFVNTVAEGRNMEPSAVDEIAQGRVWTGADAIGLGLTDETGTLMDAVRYAASLCGDSDIKSWNISTYPIVETTIIDELLSTVSQELGNSDVFADTPLHQLEYTLRRWYKASTQARFFARMPYEMSIR